MERDAPLAARMRPRTLDEYAGQQHIVGPGRLLRRAIEADQLSSLIFYGPPGTGKTTLARVIANTTRAHFIAINAVLAGVKDIRESIDEAQNRARLYNQRTILFVDEVHRFNKAQQDALLPWVENGTVIFIGATTENPYFEVKRRWSAAAASSNSCRSPRTTCAPSSNRPSPTPCVATAGRTSPSTTTRSSTWSRSPTA
ncbi:MAG: AAA family ATPase, partial [Caldilinea sp.]|nr:AAA family ATPase [Caldilinea sp.]